jgi:hypothetical protein
MRRGTSSADRDGHRGDRSSKRSPKAKHPRPSEPPDSDDDWEFRDIDGYRCHPWEWMEPDDEEEPEPEPGDFWLERESGGDE